MIIIGILFIILGVVLYTQRNKNQPVRLDKKITLIERIQNIISKYYGIVLFVFIIIALILFVAFFLMFMPGTESGLWYNGGVESAIQ